MHYTRISHCTHPYVCAAHINNYALDIDYMRFVILGHLLVQIELSPRWIRLRHIRVYNRLTDIKLRKITSILKLKLCVHCNVDTAPRNVQTFW